MQSEPISPRPPQCAAESPFTKLAKINYSSLSALESVFEDESSLSAYVNYMKGNPALFHGKRVIHLASECNCLYSIFAAQAGAQTVYCILNGHGESEKRNLYMMEEIVRENGFQQVIQVKLWKDFRVEGKVDVIIGEPMSTNLFYHGGLDRMIEVRDMYLAQTGLMVPNRLRYKCALIWDEYQKDEKLEYWDEVYGVSMKEMKKWVQEEPCIKMVDPTLVISEIGKLLEFNLYQVGYQEIDELSRTITLKHLNSQSLKANGLTVWFEAEFTSADGEVSMLDSSPWCE